MFKRYKNWIFLAIVSLIMGGLFVACTPATYGVAQVSRGTPIVKEVNTEFNLELMGTVGLVEIYEITSSRGGLCIMAIRPDMVELEC